MLLKDFIAHLQGLADQGFENTYVVLYAEDFEEDGGVCIALNTELEAAYDGLESEDSAHQEMLAEWK